ncbi:GFA family protein [Dyella sp. C9]|uniref:GFA family protein n=1 Tax=Dyella sp. C9 TaxID=2202154 RepID=UPI0018E592B1|nr:hypothetical protein [Dyella sp. C9]
MLLEGRCHCGNIHFALAWEPEPEKIPARACDCTFCRKHGGVWTGTPDGELDLRVRDATQLTRYTFGTHSAQFLVCQRCGVVPAVLCEIDGQWHAVVSVHALEDVGPERLQHVAASFGNEDKASRLARRQRNWIARVSYREGRAAARITSPAPGGSTRTRRPAPCPPTPASHAG